MISLSMMSGAFAATDASYIPPEKEIKVKVNQLFALEAPYWNCWQPNADPDINYISQIKMGDKSVLFFKAGKIGDYHMTIYPLVFMPAVYPPLPYPEDVPPIQSYHIIVSE